MLNNLHQSLFIRSQWSLFLALVFAFSVSVVTFYEGLVSMTQSWVTEEYSHAVMIPFISLFLAFQRLPTLSGIVPENRIFSCVYILFGFLLLVVGEFSALNTLIQYGFLVTLIGVIVSVFGTNGMLKLWIPIVYLVFMIPLPTIIQNNLSNELQLISSSIGVFFVRLFGISVFLEGNVIDLGVMKLQVVDACSGLRYLFPLMSFGFLISVIYEARLWQKVVIFLSTIPIAVLMNSIRIGVIGVTVEYWGKGAAEGFLHDFEGWAVFISCLAILLIEMFVLNRLTGSKKPVFDKLNLSLPSPIFDKRWLNHVQAIGKSYVVILGLLIVAFLFSQVKSQRELILPERSEFNFMPLHVDGWFGREGQLTEDILSNLKLSDYFIGDYKHSKATVPVNFYVAYYESQNKGAAIHSPKSCIPGGGWEIQSFDTLKLDRVSQQLGFEFHVNRVVIQKGAARSIVYYWFQQQGRVVTNEFINRWYIFLDSMFKGRSDGALVRVSAPWLEGDSGEITDQSLEKFILDFYPKLPAFLPD